MNIVIIATSCYRKTGGVAHATWQLAQEFVLHGHTVHIVTLMDSRDKYEVPPSEISIHRIYVKGFSIYEYKAEDIKTSSLKRLSLVPKALKYLFSVVRVVRDINPDIVHTNGVSDANAALLIKIISRIPYTITVHNDPKNKNTNLMGIKFTSKISRKYWRYLPQIRYSNKVISLTSVAKEAVSEIYGRESVIIPNGVNSNIFHPNFCARSNSDITLNLISVGLLNNAKDFNSLIKSMVPIIQVIPHAHLTIIGGGPLYNEFITLIETLGLKDYVTLSGYLPHHLIVEYLQKSHIYILSSVTEGFPLVLLEAMACGLPIVSTPVSSAPEIVNEWNNGYIVPFKSPSDIASAVIKIVQNNEIDFLSRRSLLASKEFNWPSISEKYLEVFEDIIL